jgi:hypothetical protein
MLDALKKHIRHALSVAIAFTPWVIAMYVLYWLEYGEIWTLETPHRGKTAVIILAIGMGSSFLVQSYIAKRANK